MTTFTRRATAVLTGVAGILTGVAAALGVFARGDGTYATVTTLRGETIEIATTGVYADNARQLVAEGVGWDVFTLVVAVPLLLVGAVLVARGSFRGTLLAGGMLGYATYLYLEYAVTWAFGPLFPLFVAICALSVTGLIGVASLAGAARGTHRFTDRFPARAWAGLSIAMAAMLTLLWAARIAEALAAPIPQLHGETTMTVQALDLGLIVPLLVALPILAWGRVRAAMAASAVFAVTFAAMGAAIASMMVSSWIVTGVSALPPIVAFGIASLAAVRIAARMFRSVEPIPTGEMRSTHSAPGSRPDLAAGPSHA